MANFNLGTIVKVTKVGAIDTGKYIVISSEEYWKETGYIKLAKMADEEPTYYSPVNLKIKYKSYDYYILSDHFSYTKEDSLSEIGHLDEVDTFRLAETLGFIIGIKPIGNTVTNITDDTKIKELEEQLTKAKNDMKALEDEISAKDLAITSKRAEIESLKSRIDASNINTMSDNEKDEKIKKLEKLLAFAEKEREMYRNMAMNM